MTEKKSIYAKLAEARIQFHKADLKKSGHNKFAGYKYFELGDFVTVGLDCMAMSGLVPVVTFEAERAVMRIFDTTSDACIEIESPRAAASLKGCHPIQNLGAEETYQRRYLWMAALEIVEHDAVDASQSAEPVRFVSDKQVAKIEDMTKEVGADPAKFLEFLQVKDLRELPADRFQVAVKALEAKREAAEKKRKAA